jgi:tRNA pseudouridine38-40 synthase
LPTFKISVAYDGTDYVGWQRQLRGPSIQGVLEEALRTLDPRGVTVTGAGRTDAGVHAEGQVASFSIDRAIAADALVRALNSRLPPDVRVLRAHEVPAAFHARFQALAKTYRYRIWNADVCSPFERRYAWHVPGTLDVGAMAAAAKMLEGRHDFGAFQAAGSETHSTEREILRSRVIASEGTGDHDAIGSLVTYEICGTGFLRHMVRIIVGTLVEVGRGRRTPQWVWSVLVSRDRARGGPTAPAGGLVLVAVDYAAVDGDESGGPSAGGSLAHGS